MTMNYMIKTNKNFKMIKKNQKSKRRMKTQIIFNILTIKILINKTMSHPCMHFKIKINKLQVNMI
jgi:hypothetical protein